MLSMLMTTANPNQSAICCSFHPTKSPKQVNSKNLPLKNVQGAYTKLLSVSGNICENKPYLMSRNWTAEKRQVAGWSNQNGKSGSWEKVFTSFHQLIIQVYIYLDSNLYVALWIFQFCWKTCWGCACGSRLHIQYSNRDAARCPSWGESHVISIWEMSCSCYVFSVLSLRLLLHVLEKYNVCFTFIIHLTFFNESGPDLFPQNMSPFKSPVEAIVASVQLQQRFAHEGLGSRKELFTSVVWKNPSNMHRNMAKQC